MWLRIILVACGMIGSGSAWAECRVAPVTFYPAQNDHVTIHATQTVTDVCNQNFRASGTMQYTSAQILTAPTVGKLEKTGPLSFRYRPRSTGKDVYRLSVCGRSQADSGCSTLTYIVSITGN